MKEQILGPNIEFLYNITLREKINSQIIIRYHWFKYLKKKAAKKAKKAAANAAAK